MNVISKSGTTTEPALAFRIFKALLEKKYGKDGAKGRNLRHNGQGARHAERTFRRRGLRNTSLCRTMWAAAIQRADGCGPAAHRRVRACDIDALMAGAADMHGRNCAAVRQRRMPPPGSMPRRAVSLYRKWQRAWRSDGLLRAVLPLDGRVVETAFRRERGQGPARGFSPPACIFSTDLHSMGQFMQEGERASCSKPWWISNSLSDDSVHPSKKAQTTSTASISWPGRI